MTKKETLIPIIVIALSVVFAGISFALFLSKGKSKFWLSNKMRIGALLLTFSTVTQYSCNSSCYDPIQPNYFSVETSDNYEINLDLNIDNKIYGTIHERESSEFSFNITDTLYTDTLQKGNITAADGSFDSHTEDFIFEIDTRIQSGTYYLNLYSNKKEVQTYSERNYKLNIINEN